MNNNPSNKGQESDLEFMRRVLRAETERVESLLAPFAKDHTSQAGKALSQVTSILGELGARINLVEQALEHQLTVTEQKAGIPLLLGEMELSCLELENEGLYGVERDGQGKDVRWSNGPEITFTLPLYRNKRKVLRIYFSAIIKQEYAKSLVLAVDGREVPCKLKQAAGDLCVESVLPPGENFAQTQVTLRLPGAHSPAELGVGDDPRTLGIAVRGISAKNREAGLLKILRR